jgi:head-tail adaptor
MASASTEPSAGQLRHRVTWQTVAAAPADGTCGQDAPTVPTTVGTYWAFVDSYMGEFRVNANQLKAVRRARVTMRAVGPIKAGDWLLFEGRKLIVDSVHRYEERDFWLLIETYEKAQGIPGGP